MSRQLSLFPDVLPSVEDKPTRSRTEKPPAPERAAAPDGAGASIPETSMTETSMTETSMTAAITKSALTTAALAIAAAPDCLRGPSQLDIMRQKLVTWMQEPLASLVLTENRRRIISARPTAHGLAVRIHRCFRDADDTTLRAVATFLTSAKGDPRRTAALQVIRSHFDQHRPETDPVEPRLSLQSVGQHFDLRILRDRLNQRYFDDKLEVRITWGRAPKVRRRRGRGFSILLGSYTETDQLVRIHPCLDGHEVPEYVVESVVYHEMLHAALPTERRNGRRRLHTPEFRRREQLYHDFAKANRWLEANLSRLAASR